MKCTYVNCRKTAVFGNYKHREIFHCAEHRDYNVLIGACPPGDYHKLTTKNKKKDDFNMARKNKLYQCPYDKACLCELEEPCCTCETFAAYIKKERPGQIPTQPAHHNIPRSCNGGGCRVASTCPDGVRRGSKRCAEHRTNA